jgi:hypothetical protein
VLVVLATGFGIPVLGLLCYHCRLMWISKTTIEVVSSIESRSETEYIG